MERKDQRLRELQAKVKLMAVDWRFPIRLNMPKRRRVVVQTENELLEE